MLKLSLFTRSFTTVKNFIWLIHVWNTNEPEQVVLSSFSENPVKQEHV